MRLLLIAIGEKMPLWVREGFESYRRRLPLRLDLVEVPDRQTMLKRLPKRRYTVALDLKGEEWSSEELSRRLNRWLHTGRDLTFLIGDAEGLPEPCLREADQLWSLSKLTFPHMVCRIMVVEQLYRAFAQLKGHPYHR